MRDLFRNNHRYTGALVRFVRENNAIEGIHRAPREREVVEADRFMNLDRVTVADLERFVDVYQPYAVLRRRYGMDVRVGGYIPPPGGHNIEIKLEKLLRDIHGGLLAWPAHCRYETLHPFTDGNGRSGRMLWAWQVGPFTDFQRGFLHSFYYQTLRNSSARAHQR